MSASKNCPCPVCKASAKVQIDETGWYFMCCKCATLIGTIGYKSTIERRAGERSMAFDFIGKWRTAKEAIKAIKEYTKCQQ